MSAASTVVSAPQHMQALAHANRVRLARASLKRAVLAGQLDPVEVIRTCPWEVATMPVSELLRSQRRWGRTRPSVSATSWPPSSRGKQAAGASGWSRPDFRTRPLAHLEHQARATAKGSGQCPGRRHECPCGDREGERQPEGRH